MIELNHVTFGYEKDVPVIRDLQIHIAPGESVGLIGANGAGKSTILKLLLGLLTPDAGEIRVGGLLLSKKNLPQIRHLLGYVLQDSDNQMFMPTVLEDMIFGPVNYGLSREEAGEKALQVLRQLGIEDLKDRYNHRISGGEKRMAAIATVLAMEPSALLMDEPTSALDPFNRRQVIHLIQSLPQTRLITSHDLDMIYDTCSRVILISGGRVAADGPAEEILLDEQLLNANRMELPLRFQK